MLKAGSQAQTANDNQVVNQASRRSRLKQASEKRAALPALLAVAAAVGVFAWWKRRKGNSGSEESAGRSRVTKSRQPAAIRGSGASDLPRNKLGNNKKNKERRRQERERRAEKRESQAGRSGPSDPHYKEEKDNTIILTSKFVDTTPKTVSNLPKAQRKGNLGSSSSGIDPAMSETWSRKS